MLERRIIWTFSQLTFANIEAAAIARRLVSDTQAHPWGDLGITYDTTVTGQLRDRTYEIGQNIGEMIGNLGRTINGFEWDVSPLKEFRIFYPSAATRFRSSSNTGATSPTCAAR